MNVGIKGNKTDGVEGEPCFKSPVLREVFVLHAIRCVTRERNVTCGALHPWRCHDRYPADARSTLVTCSNRL